MGVDSSSMTDARVHRVIASLCLEAGTDEELRRDARAFFERHGIDAADAEALARAPGRQIGRAHV